jgi:hypothetical protein
MLCYKVATPDQTILTEPGLPNRSDSTSIEGMSTPGERLAKYRDVQRVATGNEEMAYRATSQAVEVDCAIEIAEALAGLKAAVNDMASRFVTVMGNLTKEIERATAQAEVSSRESGKAAAESANLARKLNRLTFWIVVAALISAGAAGVQAWSAWYTVHQPQQSAITPAANVAPPAAPTPK